MTNLKNLVIFICLTFVSQATLAAHLPPNTEAGFSLANGIFTHKSGIITGSSASFLSPDFSFNYYLKPTQAIISGIDLHLNFSKEELGLFGLRAGYKWYYWGQGYFNSETSSFLTSKSQQRFSSYVGGVFKRYTYFLSNSFEAGGNFESSGNFYNFDAIFGADYMLSSKLKATSTLSITFFSLSATDSRIRMTSKLVTFGIAYLF